jgi:hypothetical protein
MNKFRILEAAKAAIIGDWSIEFKGKHEVETEIDNFNLYITYTAVDHGKYVTGGVDQYGNKERYYNPDLEIEVENIQVVPADGDECILTDEQRTELIKSLNASLS